jgi:hypothetical protein
LLFADEVRNSPEATPTPSAAARTSAMIEVSRLAIFAVAPMTLSGYGVTIS